MSIGRAASGLHSSLISSELSFCLLFEALADTCYLNSSVERVVEYLDLPQEPAAIIESNRPPAYWPSSTSENRDSMLVVEDLNVKYAPDLPAVLRNISFSLKAKERVGLLGRTGSGKSTLAMSILRFVCCFPLVTKGMDYLLIVPLGRSCKWQDPDRRRRHRQDWPA